MSCPFRFAIILLLALSLGSAEDGVTGEHDSFWTVILSDPALPAPTLMLSLFSYRGAAGLQLATVTRSPMPGATGFNIGLGYDDMVFRFQNLLDGSRVPPTITERWFLLHTGCDQRFQLTVQITW